MGFLSLFNILPGWMWAGLLAASFATNCVTAIKLDRAEGNYLKLQTQVASDKAAAAETLQEETEKTAQTEKKLAQTLRTQEQTDAANQATIADLRRNLGERLRDPGATSHCPNPQSASNTNPADSAGNPGEGGGLLSESLSQLLLTQAAEADRINIAFASCKADSIAVRVALQ